MENKSQRVAIIDLGVGNLRSVAHSFSMLGANVIVTTDAADIAAADRLVLPGVGAFAAYADKLSGSGVREVLEREAREKGKPLLGICLGMQVLATVSEEHGEHRGLGWIPGRVVKLDVANAPHLRVPHMGWNHLRPRGACPMLEGVGPESTFYFVHSYALRPDDPAHDVADCEHGATFCAAVMHENLFATQFHPEKSQRDGLRLLERFLAWKP